MKITAVDSILVALPYEHGAPKPARSGAGKWDTQTILFVRVETDAGVTGWGEAFSFNGAKLTQAAARDLIGPLTVGKEIDGDVPAFSGRLLRSLHSVARGGPIAFALSGFDTALWDIVGKDRGRPVWDLLGGSRKETIPAYASLHRLGTAEYVTKVCRTAAERGYRQIKLHEHSVEAVAAARAAVGPGIELMVDTNCFWDSVGAATAAARSFAPHGITWFEEPLYPADDYDAMARLRRAGGIPIAAGENLGDFNDVRWMVDAGAVDIVQPSVAKLGGISGVRRALDYAASHGVRGVPHSPFLGPALMATIHLIVAHSQEVPCELRYCDLEASPIGEGVIATDGKLKVPQGPGLGFEVDHAIVEKYTVS